MNHKFRYNLALSFLLTGIYCAGGIGFTFAQELAQVPAQTNPGLLTPVTTEQKQEQKLEEEKLTPKVQEDEAPKVEINVPEQAPSVHIQSPQLNVKKITWEGATLVKENVLSKLAAPYEGRDLKLDELQKLVEDINQLYRKDGYLTSQAYIPPQEVNDGVLIIRIVEGKAGKVCIQNNRFYRTSAITRRLHLEPGEPFNIKQLEGDLNQANRQTGFKLKATLSPGEQTGETNVKIEVAEKQPWQITPTFDNQGRPFIGLYRGGVELTNDSLFGYGDRLATKYIGADGTNVAMGSYFVPLNKNGDELGFSFGYSHVDVDLGVPQPEIDGVSHSAGLIYSHPFDSERVWIGDFGLNFRRVRTYMADVRDSLDEVRSVQAGLNFDKFDRLGRTFVRLQTSVGLDIFGGNAQFWKGESFITRLFRLPLDNVLILRAYGQLTSDALPSAESFQLGGAYSVRGFSEGLLVGDRGYNFTLEDRWPIPFLRTMSPWLADRLQGAVFFDIGQAWLDQSNPRFTAGSSSSEQTFLTAAGFGLRAQLSQYLQGFMDVGFGLVDRKDVESNAQPTARIHFGVRSNLLPEKVKVRSTKETCLKSKKSAGNPQTSEADSAEESLKKIADVDNKPQIAETSTSSNVKPVTNNGFYPKKGKDVPGTIGVMSILNE